MGFLAKISNISDAAAVIIIFLAWYLSASLTTLVVTGMLERIISLTLLVFACVAIFMFIVFVVSWIMRRTDLVDVAWGLAIIIAAVASFMLSNYGLTPGLNIQSLVTTLVIIWGSRLTIVIFLRFKSNPEDKRYIELRKNWKGNLALNTLVRVFMVQALLAVTIGLSVIHINLSSPSALNPYSYIGLAIWLIGFYFEAVGDFQLRRFLSDPHRRKMLMTSGLWKYTRHPNYFGEATMWLGIFIISLGTDYGWVGVISPIVITYLLLFVSGVPLAEKAAEKKIGWEQYKRQTSKFFPLPPDPEV